MFSLSKLPKIPDWVAAIIIAVKTFKEQWDKRKRRAGLFAAWIVTTATLLACASYKKDLKKLCERYPELSACQPEPVPTPTPASTPTPSPTPLPSPSPDPVCDCPNPDPLCQPPPQCAPPPTPEPTPTVRPTPSPTPNPSATPATCPEMTIICGPRGDELHECRDRETEQPALCISFDSHATRWTGAPRGLACDGSHPADVEPCGGRICEDPRGQSWRVVSGGKLNRPQGEGMGGYSWLAEFVVEGETITVECCLPPQPADREGVDMRVGRACHRQSFPRQ